MLKRAFIIGVLTLCANPGGFAQKTFQFSDLPREVQGYANDVRKSCKELNADFKPYDPMQGIFVIDLKGDGSRDLMVGNEELCNTAMAGANCSNRACPLVIWKQ